ncbi:expressed unknown protein [Seminavis robusta]|uniref:Uncharacterized protein n=1 Tax=Seminavis robusta TaxID=568900 RepID=A0A9N8E6Q4_9STRA|nr:expressed unknown protein [Seminavis robusta]|eukprot:Sro710_g191020.1 n/a (278) ;mRNA; f:15959-17049
MFALCGNFPGFFAEFKVALKSILLKTPHDRDTRIHVMAEQKAYDYLPKVRAEIQIDGIEWSETLKNGTGLKAGGIHTFGTYFRLFADEKTSPTARLQDVQKLCRCHDGLDKFWQYVNEIQWTKEGLRKMDQSMVMGVGKEYPGTVETLPAAWGITVTEHWRGARDVAKFTKFHPDAGIFHYKGGGANNSAYFDSDFVKSHSNGFGLPAIFYRDLPWTWTRFMGLSMGGPDNTGIRIQRTSFNSTAAADPIFIQRKPVAAEATSKEQPTNQSSITVYR